MKLNPFHFVEEEAKSRSFNVTFNAFDVNPKYFSKGLIDLSHFGLVTLHEMVSVSPGVTDDLYCFPISYKDKTKPTYTKLKFPISQSFRGEV